MGITASVRSRVARARRGRRSFISKRYDDSRLAVPLVELLSDDDLARLNSLLSWHCFTVDRRGRPFGAAAWVGKREAPERIPDRRIELFDERFDLAGQHVLEVGCFEGIHTIALCDRAGRVSAIDGRIENVVKTIVRCALFERHPTVFVCDLEHPPEDQQRLHADLCHHVGVLYHLTDPVSHLADLGRWISQGVMVDTHFAERDAATDIYDVGGRSYRYRRHGEARLDPFSGLHGHAKWLQLDDIVGVLRRVGFSTVEIVERRDERNGPRVLLFAEK